MNAEEVNKMVDRIWSSRRFTQQQAADELEKIADNIEEKLAAARDMGEIE